MTTLSTLRLSAKPGTASRTAYATFSVTKTFSLEVNTAVPTGGSLQAKPETARGWGVAPSATATQTENLTIG